MRAVDYAADAAVDYDAAHLWISQPFGLGRIYPGFALWIREEVFIVAPPTVEGNVGAGFAPHAPQAGLSPARSASCGCFSGSRERERIRVVRRGAASPLM